MKLVFITVASAHEKWADLAKDLYVEKISHFFSLEHLEIKPSKNSRAQGLVKLEEESQKILATLKNDDYVFVFDERGLQLNSPQFSKKIETALSAGKKRCVFIIGGAFGVSEEVRARAQVVVSFSPMVFNHLVAQTVALEQIYRAFTIQRNLPYHNF